MHRAVAILVCMCACAAAAVAQQSFKWSVDVGSVFENREGDNYYSPDQTIIFTRLQPEVGVSFMGGTHNIMGGVSWNQPMGNGWDDHKLTPVLYYRYLTPSWRFSMGMFPRTQLIEPMPTVLCSDSLNYMQPTMRGVLVQYVRDKGFFELALDWRSLQTETQREAFNVYFNGRWNPHGMLLVGGHLQVNHLAKAKNAGATQSVNDDISVNPYIGLDLASVTPLDSFVVKGGALVQLERDRSAGGWHKPYGLLIDAVAEWRFLGVKETFYVGKNQFPLYGKYGASLNMGDPNYQSKVYSRTDVYAYIFRNQFVNLYASLDFHYTREAFTFWQKMALRVYINDYLWKKKDEKVARSEYLRNNY